MLTPSYLADLAEPLVDLYEEVEAEIMKSIIQKLVRYDGFSSSAIHQIERLKDMRTLSSDINKELAKVLHISERKVANILRDAGTEGLRYDDRIYRMAGLAPTPIVNNIALNEVLIAGIKKTNGLMRNFTATTASAANKAFTNAMDKAYLEVISGAFSPQESIRRAVSNLAKQGIDKIAYPAGHMSSVDVAVRRALITGSNQTTAELQLARANEMNSDLVEVSSHAGARPTHAEWQGRVFSISGNHPVYGHFERETGYGTGEGLCGWNCYHNFYPFFEGLSSQTYMRDPASILGKSNDQAYEESQRQRLLERRVRASKNECISLNAAMSSTDNKYLREQWQKDFDVAAQLLKRRESNLLQFCNETNRTRRNDREQVYGFNRSVSTKAVWAAKRA